MGIYLNPKGMSKEHWLMRHSEGMVHVQEALRDFYKEKSAGNIIVVLVDNGDFTAAGVAYNKDELRAFTRSGDERPKIAYIVSFSALFRDDAAFSPLELEVIKEAI